MKDYFLFLTLALLLASCGGDNDQSASDNNSGPRQSETPEFGGSLFPETALWGDNLAYRTLTSQDQNTVTKVVSTLQGTTCFIRRHSSLDSYKGELEWSSAVECLDNDGENIINHEAQGSGIIKDLLLKKDGSLVIAELIDIEGSTSAYKTYYVQLSYYSATGELIKKKILRDAPDSDELYFYNSINGETTRTIFDGFVEDDKPSMLNTSLVKLIEHNDDLYLLAYTYGIKMYQLNDELEVNWDVQVMPAHFYLWQNIVNTQADISFSEGGEIFVAFELYGKDAQAYNIHFNRPLHITSGQLGIAIEVFNLAGEYQRSLVLDDGDYSEKLTGIIHHNQSLWLGANVDRSKDNAAGGASDWDILLAQVSPESGDTLAYHFIDHDKEDALRDFKLMPNDNFIFSGTTGYVKVDTGSTVSFGNGFLLEVSPQGQTLRSRVLSQPRHVRLTSMSVLDSDLVIFSGNFDGPITHTCDSDFSLCYVSGMVGIARLAP